MASVICPPDCILAGAGSRSATNYWYISLNSMSLALSGRLFIERKGANQYAKKNMMHDIQNDSYHTERYCGVIKIVLLCSEFLS